MATEYECLDGLCLDLEKELEIKKELSTQVNSNLCRLLPETKQFQKLLATNLNRSMEFHRVLCGLKVALVFSIVHVNPAGNSRHSSGCAEVSLKDLSFAV